MYSIQIKILHSVKFSKAINFEDLRFIKDSEKIKSTVIHVHVAI